MPSAGWVHFLLWLIVSLAPSNETNTGMLYPRESESRSIKDLNGMWNFRADYSPQRQAGLTAKWFQQPLSQTGTVIPMPVPSSYNDITTDKRLRDFVGWVWYDREFYVMSDWATRRVVLRVDSAHYYAIVWVNGQQVMVHVGGHLPFEATVNQYLNFGGVNRVTIAVNNTLTPVTLPPGTVTWKTDTNRYPSGYFVQNLQFDFFNYAGIHRSVRLYTTPLDYVNDITIVTSVSQSTGVVQYSVATGGPGPSAVKVDILDKQGKVVASGQGEGQLAIQQPHLWWPYTMNTTDFGYLYTMEVHVKGNNTVDVYRQPFGIRTVEVTSTQLLINKRPFYCHGVDKHEDSDIRGKGLDLALIARDFNMMKWLGVNCFRTSHYPYAEEILDQADQQGFAVIDESPGVGIVKVSNFGNVSLAHHKEVMEEMIRRDKNRPAVIMWSVANEPNTALTQAHAYFQSVIAHTRQLDPTRPITFTVGGSDYNNDQAAQFVDVMCINRYYGWYHDCGHTEIIYKQMTFDLNNWYQKFRKPIIVSEYGADTIAGLHTEPSLMFTEDYQVEFMSQYHKAFDELRPKFVVGELIWNFADFMTDQTVNRVVGNKKGILTRQRQPKRAAYLVRDRYHALAAGDEVNRKCNKL